MTPTELHAALTSIGWSARELAIRLDCHRNLPVAWLAGRTPVPRKVASWLVRLAKHHEQHPPPDDWRVVLRRHRD